MEIAFRYSTVMSNLSFIKLGFNSFKCVPGKDGGGDGYGY